MLRRAKRNSVYILAVWVFLFLPINAYSIGDYVPWSKKDKDHYDLPKETATNSVTVKFKDDVMVRLRNGQLTAGPRLYVKKPPVAELEKIDQIIDDFNATTSPTFGDGHARSEQANDQLRFRGQMKQGVILADLNNFYDMQLSDSHTFSEIEPVIDQLNELDIVEIAYASPNTNAPFTYDTQIPPSAITPSSTVQGSQGYLANNNNGIHAVNGWLWNGASGGNVRVMDVEKAMNPNHEDLNAPFYLSWYPFLANYTGGQHGVAVAGIIAAKDNGFGVTGIVPNTSWGFATSRRCTNTWFWSCYFSDAAAINQVIPSLNSGDVLLIESHIPGPTFHNCSANDFCNYVPAEYNAANFAAIQTAVANGIVVVAAAGNGGVNLDDPIYEGRFDRSVRDSGAIIVGAARSNNYNGVVASSNYGSRVDARAWGENVATLGYYGPSNDATYTANFSGTSSASAIVAGAAASIQSAAIALGLDPLTSQQMRDLIQQTGTPQTYETNKNIGAMPNIHAAITELQSNVLSCDLNGGETQTWNSFDLVDASVTNFSQNALQGWTVTIDFVSNIPIVQSNSSNIFIDTFEDKLIVSSTGTLPPGESALFSISGIYNGSSYVQINCH